MSLGLSKEQMKWNDDNNDVNAINLSFISDRVFGIGFIVFILVNKFRVVFRESRVFS